MKVCNAQLRKNEVSGSHRADDAHVCILERNAVWPFRHIPSFQRNILSPYSKLQP
jgi:hypothetical protein